MTFRRVYIDGAGALANRAVADAIRDALRAAKGQHLDITIEPHRDRRSERANDYLWSVVYALMAEHTGQSDKAIHEAMVARFLPSEAQRVAFFHQTTGEQLEYDVNPRRSSKLGVRAFYDYVENVRQFAAEWLGVETPAPDPEYWRAALTPRV